MALQYGSLRDPNEEIERNHTITVSFYQLFSRKIEKYLQNDQIWTVPETGALIGDRRCRHSI